MSGRRNIVRINEDLCNGCGQCALACAEAAIEIVDGKARLVSETCCDGLGACLGECPQGALTIEEREAQAFDPRAVEEHLRDSGQHAHREQPLPCGCPGTASQTLARERCVQEPRGAAAAPSELGNWPVQLHLVPPTAPYLRRARLLIASDCVPFAFAGFHRRFLSGRVLLVGCPKLDDAASYGDKLAQILHANAIESVEVAYMEVPCCYGMVQLVRQAISQSGRSIPLTLTKIAIRGQVLEMAAA